MVGRACAIVILVLVFTSIASAAQLKMEPGAATEHDYRKALLDFNRRTLIDAYKTIGRKDPKWDEPATKLLDAVAVYFTNASAPSARYRFPSQPTKNLQAYGKAAMDAGCDDPIVIYCYGAILDDSNKDAEALPLLKRAIELIPQSHYPINRAFSAARRMAQQADRQQDEAAAAQYQKQTRDFALASISVAEFKGLDRRIVLRLVRDWFTDLPVAEQKAFCEDAAKLKSDPWMLHILTAEYHYAAGWEAHGHRFLSEVPTEGMQTFRREMPIAANHFIAAWRLEKNFPEPASRMIGVAMAGHSPEGDERTWFNRATAAQFDYANAYSSMLIALLPRWGGSHRKMFEFGLDCAATERYDTDVPWQLVNAVERIEHDDRDVNMSGTTQVWSRAGVYEKVREVCSTYAKQAADDDDRRWYRSYLAGVAWQMGEYRESGQIVVEMGEKIHKAALLRTGLLPQRLTGAFDAASGPHAASITEAENAARRADFATALKTYEELAGKIVDPAPAATWVRNRTAELKWKIAFEAGEAVNLMPADDKLAGWYPLGGTWKRDGAYFYGANSATGLTILCGGDFGKRFELTGRVEMDPNPALPEVSVGPIIAWETSGQLHQVFLRKKAQAMVLRRNTWVWGKFPIALKASNTFKLQVYDGAAWGAANDKPLFNALELADFTVEDPTLIGVCGQRTVQLRVRYRDLKIRKLTAKPTDAATQPVAAK